MGRYAIHFVNVKNDTGSLACFSELFTKNFHHDFHTLYSLRVTPVFRIRIRTDRVGY
jgi:hypothetical protein